MKTRIACGAIVAAVLAGVPVSAQQPPAASPLAQQFVDPANGLSLDQAIARAVELEPSLRAARSQIDVARGMREQASLKPNLAVTFEWREEPGGSDRQTSIGMQWPLDLFRRDSRVAVAEREVTSTQLAVADRERLLIADVRTRYGDLLAAVRDLTLFDDVVTATRRQHALLRARVEEGASAPIDRDLLDVELRRLDAERLLQAGRTEAALFELKRVLAMPANAPLAVRETLEDVVRRESEGAVDMPDESAAIGSRADVREAAARVDVAAAKIDRAEDIGRLDVNVFANYMRMDAGFPQYGFAPDGSLTPVRGQFHYVVAGAMVTIPLLNRNQGEAAAARAERDGAAAAHEAAKLSAATELAAARARDERARQAVTVYRAGAQALARQNLTVITQSYDLGRVTVFEVLAEQRRYLDLEQAYTETLRAAYEARTALNRAIGAQR